MNPSYDILLVGLGNPGTKYKGNRHNLGWMVLDALHEEGEWSTWGWTEKGLICCGNIGDHKVLMLKPTTMMNLSGEAVVGVLASVDIPHEHVIVVHDELDIPFATVRSKFSGGAAGHRGVANIADVIATRDFHRVRCGIGRPAAGGSVLEHVLSDFVSEEHESIPGMLADATHCIKSIVTKIFDAQDETGATQA